ncbi:MAG: hypothetical protein HKN35_15745 [Woeseia sp.]|nr:hypothetical protein [Woeseia sp.]
MTSPAKPDLLLQSDGSELYVDESESCNITNTLYDATGVALATASILTLTATLKNASDGAIINSINGTDVLNAGKGVVADNADGEAVLTLRLEPADNAVITETDTETLESHYLMLEWTWNDGVASRTGRHWWEIRVQLSGA